MPFSRVTRRSAKSSFESRDGGAIPLGGNASDYDPLLELVGDASFVLIGESSHGTHEFYGERAVITRRLIEEKNFRAVCIEGDWPDAARVDCWLRGDGTDVSPAQALEGFRRFPTWMWRNVVVRDFVAWARKWNDAAAESDRVSLSGLDLYSLFTSIEAVLSYLDRVDPEAARRARARYACFDHFGQDGQTYGHATAADLAEPCEQEAVRQMLDVQAHASALVARNGTRSIDDAFSAEQNARVVLHAEQYYREMFRGRASSWNLRDRHMAETLDAVHRHLEATGREQRVVVWAHNSHLGDARFTDMRRRREINLGQLAREHWGMGEVRLIGLTTSRGTVTAAHDWDEPGHRMRVRPPLADSWEQRFSGISRSLGADRFYLPLRGTDAYAGQTLLQRAIGVIYRPETERMSHYYDAELASQFDAIIHIEETSALRALEPGEHWERDVAEPPETYPTGI